MYKGQWTDSNSKVQMTRDGNFKGGDLLMRTNMLLDDQRS